MTRKIKSARFIQRLLSRLFPLRGPEHTTSFRRFLHIAFSREKGKAYRIPLHEEL
ncbi:MAG TPA: hypothetical protein VNL14_13935 [Candidatus Acidoferrales bacterium]|nr:hypothetical protein [Candidatus Acidoferrales bacterium]